MNQSKLIQNFWKANTHLTVLSVKSTEKMKKSINILELHSFSGTLQIILIHPLLSLKMRPENDPALEPYYWISERCDELFYSTEFLLIEWLLALRELILSQRLMNELLSKFPILALELSCLLIAH